MRVLLTGGTGFIGSSVLRALRANGHQVRAVVRSDASAKAVTEAGAEALPGDVTEVPWLTDRLRESDAAIHLAELGPAGDDAVITAALAAFAGTTKPFVYTGGVWTWGENDAITEESPEQPAPISAWRGERQQRLLTSGLKASVVSPGIVHGHGKGIPTNLFSYGPKTPDGAVRLVGAGTQHWTTVHVDDVADLYVLVLEKAPGGSHYIGATDHSPTVREIAAAAAGPGGKVAAESPDESRERLGAGFADALLLSQQVGEVRSRRELGWQPTRPTLLTDIAS